MGHPQNAHGGISQKALEDFQKRRKKSSFPGRFVFVMVFLFSDREDMFYSRGKKVLDLISISPNCPPSLWVNRQVTSADLLDRGI